jgi:hypothetical protein
LIAPLLIGALIYSAIVLPQHIALIWQLMSAGYVTSALRIAFGLLTEPWHVIGVFSTIVLIFSIVVLMVYVLVLSDMLRKRIRLGKSVFHWSGSMWTALLAGIGYGCAACGVAISGYIFSALGLGFIVAFLPLGGIEFTLLGIVVGCYGIYTLLKRIAEERR